MPHPDHRRLFHYALVILLFLFLYLGFIIVRPLLTYLVSGAILAYVFHPVYRHLAARLKRPRLASGILLVLILLLIIVPSALVVSKLIMESVSAYNALRALNLAGFPVVDQALAPFGLDMELALEQLGKTVKDYVVNATPNILGSVAEVLLGLFVMFFLMFYAFTQGESWIGLFKQSLPLDNDHKVRLFQRMGSLTSAVVYGQLLTAVIQGTLGGLLFLAFGVPNPVFWGFIMIILSIIPFLGTPLIWGPAGLLKLAHGEYLAGIGILLLGSIVLMNIDNVIRPYLISTKDKLHPVLILIGVLGGLQLFGFIGIVLGPLVLALLQTVFSFLNEHVRKRDEALSVRKRAKREKRTERPGKDAASV